MPGESVVTIPGELVMLVRSGAYGGLYASLGELRVLIEGNHNLGTIGSGYEPIEACLARFDGTRALLDLVGWTHFPVKGEVEVDLAEHRRATRDALGARLADRPEGDLVRSLRALLAVIEAEREGKRMTHPEVGTEYLLIPALLTHPERWRTRGELREYLDDVDPDAIDRALDDLHAEGIVMDGDRVRASACARHMNELVGNVIEQSEEA